MYIPPVSGKHGYYGSNDSDIQSSFTKMHDDMTKFIDSITEQHGKDQLSGMALLFQEFKTTFGSVFPDPAPDWLSHFCIDADAFNKDCKTFASSGSLPGTLEGNLSKMFADIGKIPFADHPDLLRSMISDEIQHKIWQDKTPPASEGYLFKIAPKDKDRDHAIGFMQVFSDLVGPLGDPQSPQFSAQFNSEYSQFSKDIESYTDLSQTWDPSMLGPIFSDVEGMLQYLPPPTHKSK